MFIKVIFHSTNKTYNYLIFKSNFQDSGQPLSLLSRVVFLHNPSSKTFWSVAHETRCAHVNVRVDPATDDRSVHGVSFSLPQWHRFQHFWISWEYIIQWKGFTLHGCTNIRIKNHLIITKALDLVFCMIRLCFTTYGSFYYTLLVHVWKQGHGHNLYSAFSTEWFAKNNWR